MSFPMTWEQAVVWLREQPDQQQLVSLCYYDDPVEEAARRFARSAEWQAVADLLPSAPGDVLDLGAGRGISSYAFAVQGWKTVALEPDPSPIVGAGAIRTVATRTGTTIRVVEEKGEELPFPDASFDVVYGRQVLHHASDLFALIREVARVLRSGGTFIATREHVINRPEDLTVFLDSHPLHHLYGGENAFTLSRYLEALSRNRLRTKQVVGPYESPINYFPLSRDDWKALCRAEIEPSFGHRLALLLTNEAWVIGRSVLAAVARRRSRRDSTPGRLYSFVATKPLSGSS
jgi:SAM-dependent methyltransferase